MGASHSKTVFLMPAEEMAEMILTVTPNPCVDKTVFIDTMAVGTNIRSKRCTCIPGGKGTNVSRAIKAMGRATKAMVLVGGRTGEHVVDMIRQQDGVDPIPVWVESPTRTITTVLEESVHRQTAFFEPGSRVTEDEALNFKTVFAKAVQSAKVVTLSGTVSDPNIQHIYRELVFIAKAAGVVTILDSHGPEFAQGLESVPDMAKPNVPEAQELVGFGLETDDAKWKAIDLFHEKGIRLVVLSLGKGGAFVSDGSRRLHVRPPEIHEVNAVGSGDALVAGFAIGLLEGMPLDVMAALGVAAGTANAMTWDIGHFSPDQVQELIRRVTTVEV